MAAVEEAALKKLERRKEAKGPPDCRIQRCIEFQMESRSADGAFSPGTWSSLSFRHSARSERCSRAPVKSAPGIKLCWKHPAPAPCSSPCPSCRPLRVSQSSWSPASTSPCCRPRSGSSGPCQVGTSSPGTRQSPSACACRARPSVDPTSVNAELPNLRAVRDVQTRRTEVRVPAKPRWLEANCRDREQFDRPRQLRERLELEPRRPALVASSPKCRPTSKRTAQWSDSSGCDCDAPTTHEPSRLDCRHRGQQLSGPNPPA